MSSIDTPTAKDKMLLINLLIVLIVVPLALCLPPATSTEQLIKPGSATVGSSNHRGVNVVRLQIRTEAKHAV
jgi:hypothetical protein